MTTLFSIVALLCSAIPTALIYSNKLQLQVKDDACEQDKEAVRNNWIAIKGLYTIASLSSLLAILTEAFGS